MAQLKSQVLKCFKHLHRTRQNVFSNDNNALAKARDKINEEFKKQKHVSNKETIEQLIRVAKGVDHELKTNIIQAIETKPGLFRANITKDTVRLDNVMFNDACCKETKFNSKK